MKKTFRKTFIIMAIFFIPVMVSAVASITSLTMTPPNPTFGDAVTVVINYCASAYNKNAFALAISTNPTLVDASKSGLGQVFVVSKAGVDVATSKPALTPGGPIEWVSNTGWGWYAGPAQCLDCAGGNGWATTETYVVHIPSADNFPGCNNTNLYLHAGFKDNNMNETDWVGLGACETESLSWSIPLFTPAFELQKSAEGVIQSVGDLVLFSIDYKYQNGSLVISDNIPGGGALELVSVGPQSITGGSVVTPGAGATSGTVTWTLPNRTGVKGNAEGTVFMLLRVKTALTAGTVITNTASGTMGGVGTKTSTVSVTAGAAMLTINKSQSDNIVHSGDYETYYLEYEVNGLKLQAYRPIDDLALGTYSAAPPAGFKFAPEGGTNGTWYVEDPCSTGDRVIRGDSGTSQYPALLLDGPDSTFCDGGIVQTDAYIGYGSGTYEGSDALVIIRNNGLTGAASKAYGVLLSVDDAPGTAGTFVKMQKTAGGATTWPTGSATPHILASKWYRVKVTVAAGSPYTFNVKVWPKGDPEPGANSFVWTDPTGAADGMSCTSGDTWTPGFGQQGGAAGDPQDSYNNFVVYQPRTVSDAKVYDTIPASLTYAGASPAPASTAGGVVRWDIGAISNQSGTFTWWGQVTGCTNLTNQSYIDGTLQQPVYSNIVTAQVICGTPTFTVTYTQTSTSTFTRTYTPTFTATPSRTPTNTYTPTASNTPSRTATSTFTNTNSPTPTFTATPTRTATSTYTNTNTYTPTYTATSTRTSTPTYSATRTYTPTITDTPTFTIFTMTVTPTSTPTFTATSTYTPSPTSTDTRTFTPSRTATPTYTATNSVTDTPTYTATRTHTPTITDTPTFTIFTMTVTPTSTPTFTDTPTFTATKTATPTVTETSINTSTFTPTYTCTFTDTPTFTATPTYTFTRTVTPTVTETAVNSATNTPTATPTFTASPTFTPTYTPTFTRTVTNTSTDTATPTYTPTDTPTYTPTFTFTDTYTFTATPTITPTLPPFPYILSIGVYNEAGELVRTVVTSPVSSAMNGAYFSVGSNTDPDTMVPGDPLAIYMPGMVTPGTLGQPGSTFYWDGTTDAQQPVASGNYFIKITQKDTYDHTNVLIKSFSVLRAEEYVEMKIFNSAGELVRVIKKNAAPPDRVDLAAADLFVVEKTGNNITINYGPGLTDYMKWDGKNDQGAAVTSGTYEIQVTTKTMSGTMAVVSKTVMILSEGNKYVEEIKAYPNPYYGIGDMIFEWTGTGTGEMKVNIHNINGELIKSLSGRIENGSLSWNGKTTDGSRAGHGYYICIFKAKNSDGYVEQKKLKIAIMGF